MKLIKKYVCQSVSLYGISNTYLIYVVTGIAWAKEYCEERIIKTKGIIVTRVHTYTDKHAQYKTAATEHEFIRFMGFY